MNTKGITFKERFNKAVAELNQVAKPQPPKLTDYPEFAVAVNTKAKPHVNSFIYFLS